MVSRIRILKTENTLTNGAKEESVFKVQIFVMFLSHVAWMGEKRNAYRLLVGKPEGKRLIGRPRCRWVDNIRMEDRNRWRALVNSVLNLQVP
jgi:hypothetical protein